MSDADVMRSFGDAGLMDNDEAGAAATQNAYWAKRKAGFTPEQAYIDIMTAAGIPHAAPGGAPAGDAPPDDEPGGIAGLWNSLFGGDDAEEIAAPQGADGGGDADEWAAFQAEVRQALAEPDPED